MEQVATFRHQALKPKFARLAEKDRADLALLERRREKPFWPIASDRVGLTSASTKAATANRLRQPVTSSVFWW
jgi:hypothetical protein